MFPNDLPAATLFYLWFYMGTLVVHVAFMNYVLAGSVYLAITSLFRFDPAGAGRQNLVASVLRDWLPFALGLAITAGVAPVLFVQVLYKHHFYTANLLLFHRWMSMLPILIVAFYLLYIIRTRWAEQRPAPIWLLLHVVIFACFAFIAYTWAENHVLSRHPEAWADFYVARKWFYWNREIPFRWILWLSGATATMATLVGWQLFALRKLEAQRVESEVERVSLLALTGLILSAVFGMVYFAVCKPEVRDRITGSEAALYLAMVCAGLLIQAVAWAFQLRQQGFHARWLGLASAGGILTLLGVVVIRESVRLGSIPIKEYAGQHGHAATVGGFTTFLVFLVINTVLIAGSIYLVRHSKMFVDSGEK
jgi:hypothetical protein